MAGISIQALIDSGSEISCIADSFYREHLSIFGKLHCLPVLGQAVRGATGARTVSIKRQVFIPTRFENGYKVDLIFLVVPFLNERCIIGYDLMKNLKLKLDSESNIINIGNNKTPINLH